MCCIVGYECWYPWCVFQDIAVEAAFSQSGVTRLADWRLARNEETLSRLEEGSLYRDDCDNWGLLASSRGEKLAMEDKWGHPAADLDWMFINGAPKGVYVAVGQEPRGQSCLEYSPEGCPAAYCKLKVTDSSRLQESEMRGSKWCDESCVEESHGKLWLNTYNALQKMKDSLKVFRDYTTLSGPSAADPYNDVDFVQTLVCSSPHANHEFSRRSRGSWPPVSLITYILQMPMLLVLIGHKGSPESESKQQARMSWSHLELKLIKDLPESIRQGYIACKYIIKRFLKAHRGQNETVSGRSHVSSYHLKVVFLRYLEKRPPSQITSPFVLFLDLLHELDNYLKVGKLPHYFLAECNLLETVADDERGIARQAIAEILSDPLNALLTSLTDPQQIYGEVCPDDLVTAFHTVSSHLTREQFQKLSELLTHVDERRRQKFKEQQKWDKILQVSGRNEPTGLTDMLKQIERIII